jgi:rubredoxin
LAFQQGQSLQSSVIVDKLSKNGVDNTRTWMCLICGWLYEEAAGDPEHGIAPGTAWADVPMNWTCPECGARKEDFEMAQI